MVNFTKRQWLTLIIIGIADFFNALCVALQAPFYPAEAEKKGCTATEYGLVFGIFELVVFIVSPFYGQHLNKIGTKISFNGGIYITSICAILFGLLDKIDDRYAFISLSFIIRIIEALGNAAFLTASFAIIAKEFPDNVSTTFASLETFFGLGLIVGPTVGGALYQIGGYTVPFAVMGSALFASAILAAFILPKQQDDKQDKGKDGPSVFKALKVPAIVLACSSTMVTSTSIGFLQATMEPHLRTFHLTPVVLGLMFVINGGVYAISAPAWGWICDRYGFSKLVIIVGSFLVASGFCLIGPAPFIPFPTILWVSILGLVLHGFGMGALLVASFGEALRTAISHGFPNNVETFGLISGLWTSSFALGAFIGPSISGILYDSIGFRKSSMFIVCIHLVVGITTIVFVFINKRPKLYVEIQQQDDTKLPNGDAEIHPAVTVTESVKSFQRSVRNEAISIEKSRPPAMNSLMIACNSYKSQAWSDRESANLTMSPYNSYSYGAVNNNCTKSNIFSRSTID